MVPPGADAPALDRLIPMIPVQCKHGPACESIFKVPARDVCFPILLLINLGKLIVAHLAVCANANAALFKLVCDWDRQSPFDVLIFHTLLILLFQKLFELPSF